MPRWRVHPRYAKIEIDGVIYTHGEAGRGGQHAAIAQAKDNFKSLVLGHYHSQAGVTWAANQEHRIFGMSAGCGIDFNKLQFEYGRKIAQKPLLGCGVVIDGQEAYFIPWLLKCKSGR